MFAFKASNVLILDEPSNHLDVECIEALGDALSTWGTQDGAVVVVSHDRAFCKSVGFTHVGTVKDGGLILEERGMQDKDWERYDLGSDAPDRYEEAPLEKELTPEEKELEKKRRKQAFNAPKQIAKLEELIEKAEMKIVEYDEKLMNVGNDMEKLMDITNKKQCEEDKVAKMMEEWEELETVVAEFS